jgi:hypothetical protein
VSSWAGDCVLNYPGNFKDGHRDGDGTYTFADGSVYKGKFNAGKQLKFLENLEISVIILVE